MLKRVQMATSAGNDGEGKFSEIDKRVKALKKREVIYSSSASAATLLQNLKLSTFDSQTLWRVFKMQFDVISESNNWSDVTKAIQLVPALRGSAEDALQTVPVEKLHDISTIAMALVSRIGEAHLTDYYQTELKTAIKKRMKSCRSLPQISSD